MRGRKAGADDLHAVDVESAVLTGTLVRTEPDPVRGPKHVIEGTASDLETRVDAVIITVYEIQAR